MRIFIFLIFLSTILLSAGECTKKTTAERLKGRLEITGICMNYTISLVEGDLGKDAIESDWTDEVTSKSYHDVFKLGNPCNFPAGLKQGDEFYFIIDTAKQKECMVCLAYYPTPSKALSIKVVE